MTEKRKKKDKSVSIEELYRNKNFVPPKEKNLETIFEEPRKSKDGAPVLTSVKKFKRYLHFDTTMGKIQKRKLKAKKCSKKLKTGHLNTRSSTKVKECPDISLYISEVLGESSDSDLEEPLLEVDFKDSGQSKVSTDSSGATKRHFRDIGKNESSRASSDSSAVTKTHFNDIQKNESSRGGTDSSDVTKTHFSDIGKNESSRAGTESSRATKRHFSNIGKNETLHKKPRFSASDEVEEAKDSLQAPLISETETREIEQTSEKDISAAPDSDVKIIKDNTRSSCNIT